MVLDIFVRMEWSVKHRKGCVPKATQGLVAAMVLDIFVRMEWSVKHPKRCVPKDQRALVVAMALGTIATMEGFALNPIVESKVCLKCSANINNLH